MLLLIDVCIQILPDIWIMCTLLIEIVGNGKCIIANDVHFSNLVEIGVPKMC